jgi:hypothetical protein
LSRSFRFVRFDKALQPLAELNLRCLDATDALLLGGRIGWRVEVWDGVRALGVVGEGALAPPAPSPELSTANFSATALDPANAETEFGSAIQPIALPQTLPAYQSAPRAYNPFRKGAWQRQPRG